MGGQPDWLRLLLRPRRVHARMSWMMLGSGDSSDSGCFFCERERSRVFQAPYQGVTPKGV